MTTNAKTKLTKKLVKKPIVAKKPATGAKSQPVLAKKPAKSISGAKATKTA